jgi:hypothetical protein
MVTPRLSLTRFIVCLVSVFMLGTMCKGNQQNSPIDQNLKGIVELDEVLGESTPAQFASQSLKDIFYRHDTVAHELQQRQLTEESKNDVFQKSFLKYIKDVYNKKDYALALSQDASHIKHFLDLSNEMSLDTHTVYVGMRLFYNKFKAAELVDDHVIAQLIETIPGSVERHFSTDFAPQTTTDLAFIKKNIESTLLSKLTDHIKEFQAAPDLFLSALAEELAVYCKQHIDNAQKQAFRVETRERLRQATFRLFDTILSKAIWDPKSNEGIWKSFTAIANSLQLLGNHGIINHMDDLDDLLWTLTHRFCFFLDLTGAALPVKFYHTVEHDLEHKAVFFLEFKEQDDGIVSKKETLAEALLKAKARSIAYEKSGIIATTTVF